MDGGERGRQEDLDATGLPAPVWTQVALWALSCDTGLAIRCAAAGSQLSQVFAETPTSQVLPPVWMAGGTPSPSGIPTGEVPIHPDGCPAPSALATSLTTPLCLTPEFYLEWRQEPPSNHLH